MIGGRRGRRARHPTAALPTGPLGDEPLFELDGVRVERSATTVLRIDRLALAAPGATAIVGPSGSGKSTLLRLLNRLEVPAAGSIRYRGRDLAAMDPLQLRRAVSMVFQQPIALAGTVADDIRVADPDLDDDGVAAALVRVGLPAALAGRAADQLSGGERQRVALARSLATAPGVLLLDEATSALDPASAQRVEELVAGLVADGIRAIWVSHDLEALERIADRVVVVIGGRISQHGPLEEVRAHPSDEVARFLDGDET